MMTTREQLEHAEDAEWWPSPGGLGTRTRAKHSEHLADVLDALVELIRAYVVMSAEQADAAALWAAHTHALDAFETTPFLDLTSPEKRCGKSRTLDVLELIVARPWRTIMPTEAVLYRKIAATSPTILLDEADAIFDKSNGSTEPLRALLNAGNRRGTSVPRCVGPTQELVDFPTFCAKALAGIGQLPDTVRDRSIVLRLERKRPDEQARRFRRREALEIAEPIAQELASWAQAALPDLEAARPDIPEALNDRAEEAWEPLLAIAELAGGAWPERARRAALELSAAGEAEDEALGPWLLRDIRDVFDARGVDRLSSADLAAALNEIETSPWGDIRGRSLDARALARRLRHFGVRPRKVRLDDERTLQGYRLEDFEDAFARYLGTSERNTGTTRMDTGFAADSRTEHVPDRDSRKPAWLSQCSGVPDKNPQQGEREQASSVNSGVAPAAGEPGFEGFVRRRYAEGFLTERERDARLALHRAYRRLASAQESGRRASHAEAAELAVALELARAAA
jgi:hypothetical protein